MNKKMIALSAFAVLSLGVVTGADAAPPPWAYAHGYHDHYHGDRYRGGVRVYDNYYGYGYAPPVIVGAPPVYVEAPPPPPAPPMVFNDGDRTFRNDNGQYCREYQSKINVGGRLRNSFGTACQQPDGSWQVIN